MLNKNKIITFYMRNIQLINLSCAVLSVILFNGFPPGN